MARRPEPLDPRLGDAFSVAEARRRGVSPGRLRARDLETPYVGARVRREDADLDTRGAGSARILAASDRRREITRNAAAYSTVMAEHAFFSHATAAALWGLPLPSGVASPDALDVSVAAPHRAPRAAGIRGHQLAPHLVSVRTRDGMTLASPAATWAQLGGILTLDDLVAAGDAILHRPRTDDGHRTGPEAARGTLAHLEAAIEAGRRLGARVLREALPLLREGVASPTETALRLGLSRAGLPDPILDYDVRDGDGRLVGCTEFAYPSYSLLIECEGDQHRTDRRQWNRDIEKYGRYQDLGWTVLRFSAIHLTPSVAPAVHRIRRHLEQRGWRRGTSG